MKNRLPFCLIYGRIWYRDYYPPTRESEGKVMKVYIVEVCRQQDKHGKVSQEGYSTLEKAQGFCESRLRDAETRGEDWDIITPYLYRIGSYDYLIREIDIR